MKIWKWNAAACGLAAGMFVAGCGTPGAPLPPSLKLPEPVTNLTAARTGNKVTLTWTMPKKTTDKLPITGTVPVRICRKEHSSACLPVPGNLAFAAETKVTFDEILPAELASGAARPLIYFVELNNPHGRSAGPSNGGHVLAGEAPTPVAGLSAQLRKDGVVLRWTADAADTQATAIRLHRTLVTHQAKVEPAGKPSAQQGIFAPAPEPVEQNLLVETGSQPGRSIDKTILFGRTYEYRAQRVARVVIDGETVELAGPLSEPIRVEAVDVFPPAIPTGLAAVATAADSATGASIDLSWLPVAEADLAGYAIYRREGDGAWERISPSQAVVGPGFHDVQVQPGHTYRYAVTAIDQGGHESARSVEAEETVPST